MSVQLKVFVTAQDKTVVMRFNMDMGISEVLKQIKEKTGEGGADHGLYLKKSDVVGPAKWLRTDKTLAFYDFHNNDEVVYKKKHRTAKIRLMDDTIKTTLIDDSLTVLEVVRQLAEKFNIGDPEEYSLMAEGKEGWLKVNLSLPENEVEETRVLILKKKFFYNDNIDKGDPVQLHLLYVQLRDAVVSGTYPVSVTEACQLAALQVQAVYGNHNPAVHKIGFLKLTDFMAPQWSKKKELEKDVYKEHKKLIGMIEINAKYRYVQFCRSLKTYGITTFLVKFPKKTGTRKKGEDFF